MTDILSFEFEPFVLILRDLIRRQKNNYGNEDQLSLLKSSSSSRYMIFLGLFEILRYAQDEVPGALQKAKSKYSQCDRDIIALKDALFNSKTFQLLADPISFALFLEYGSLNCMYSIEQ